MASAKSERRIAVLENKIKKLEADLSADKRELRAIKGGVARGRARVDRSRDAEVAREYAKVADQRYDTGERAAALDMSVDQFRRIAKRDAKYQAGRSTAEQLVSEPVPAVEEPVPEPAAPQVDDRFGELKMVGRQLLKQLSDMDAAISKPDLKPDFFGPASWIGPIRSSINKLTRLLKTLPQHSFEDDL
jgi:hypothetical protein